MTKRWLILLGFCLGVFSLLVSAQTQAATVKTPPKALQKVKVQLNWNHQFEFAGFYAALAKGYYQALGLEVELVPWEQGKSPLAAVLSGQADFGVGYSTVVVDYIKGAPIELVSASFQYSPMVLLSHAPVVSLADLKQKKLSYHGDLQIRALLNLAYNDEAEQNLYVEQSSGNLDDFIQQKVDLYGAYATNEPHHLDRLGIPYSVIDPKHYGIQSYGNLLFVSQSFAKTNSTLVRQFNEATLKGWEYALYNQSEIVDYLLQHYPVVKTREDLIAEAQSTSQYVQFGDTPIGTLSLEKLKAIAISAKETGLINQDLLDKADLNRLIFKDTQHFLSLEELNYLKQNPVIRLAIDNAWAPFEFVDEQGVYQGMAADYFKLFEQKLGVKFEAATDQNWNSALQKVYEGEYPVLSCAVSSPKRQTYLNFTHPYLSFPMVLLARNTVKYIEDYADLSGKIIAVTRGYWSQEYLEENYPKVSLLLVNSVEQGVEAVLRGEAYAYSGNLAAINFALKKQGIDGLHIIGQAEKRFELAIGVHKSQPLLLSILDKSLKDVTPEQEQQIYNRWIKLEMVNKLDLKQIYALIWPYVLGLFSVLLLSIVLLFYQRQKSKLLAQLVAEKAKHAQDKALAAEQQVLIEKNHRQEQAKFFAMITHELKTPVAMIDGAMQSLALLTPVRVPEIERRYERIRRAASRINDLVQRFLQQDSLEAAHFTLNLRPFALTPLIETLTRHCLEQRRVQFINRLSTDMIVADPTLIELALSNLLDNAHKYSPLDQRILVTLDAEPADDITYWQLSVVDFGDGLGVMPIEDIFKPYQRGASIGDIPGVGLGLYLVQKIARLHGGEVVYQPQKEGTGSVFTLTIPQNESL